MITEWRRLDLPMKDAAIIVAVSGGADSIALLLAIDELRKKKKLSVRIVAAHFDHRLRDDSASDLEHVRRLTKERRIELAHSEWKKRTPGNLEQEARRARYRFLLRTAENVNTQYILTGHTMNDQAETVLMNLIRGSGSDGLGGMQPKKIISGLSHYDKNGPLLPFTEAVVTIVRPMMRWAKRVDTENFCREMKMSFCLDPMNEDLRFRRVWIRKTLIPLLEEVNPKIVDALCRTAELMQEDAKEATAAKAETSVKASTDAQPTLYLRDLKSLERPQLFKTIREWLKTGYGDLRRLKLKHIEAVADLVQSKKSGKLIELPVGGRVSKRNGRLVFEQIKVEKSPPRT
ncbi:tRNA lysidine(34) synthetase TilS [Leptolyngbya sp. 7M]|uniref:tRNA lysidine(34) synthetase TilS n=1 Tax=Leptolyngbya sp. 7M TaxID=2812896 RepID=UPI001B8C2F80|nr:tRNA lysidine(34) synthetase TilS [Leptolyngbya sp. 7M]QYO66274.1 tRNA lysidine(34) synthetase TilS [Leptolyngbya sp. 7M]